MPYHDTSKIQPLLGILPPMFVLTLQERQRKREASPAPPPPAEEAAGLSKDAAAAENSAAMAVAAGEVAAATAQAQAAVPGSEEHKTAEVSSMPISVVIRTTCISFQELQ